MTARHIDPRSNRSLSRTLVSLVLATFLLSSFPARGVDDTLLMDEMAFVEKIAEMGYFKTARHARDQVKELPGLTQRQRAFMDLVEATINVKEILELEELATRKKKLEEAISFLKGIVEKLPTGSTLRVVAWGREVTTYIDVVEGYVEEIDRIRMDLEGGVGSAEPQKARLEKLIAHARDLAAQASELARTVQEEYFNVFYDRLNAAADEGNPAVREALYKSLETIFMSQVRYERAVAQLFVPHARLYPRTSERRRELFEEGYWFTMDIDEHHSKYLNANYFTPMNFIRLAGVVDQPLPEQGEAKEAQELQNLLGEIPESVTLIEETFEKNVVGEHKGRGVKVGQEDRPKCLYFKALSYYRLAKGAFARAEETEGAQATDWKKQGRDMLTRCRNALKEIDEGKDSVVGPVPSWLQKKASLDVKVPLMLLDARLSHEDEGEEAVAEMLVQAKQICDALILSPDQSWAEEAKKHMAVVTNLQKRYGVEGIETPGELIADADRLYSYYLKLKRQRPRRDPEARAEWEQERADTLRQMREGYLKAIRKLEEAEALPPAVRADYTAKAWYLVALASFYLEDYYHAYIANQHVLQAFPVDDYSAERFPGVERYRKYAARNVVGAASRQRKRTGAAFDRKMYAWSLIWKIRYETEMAKRRAEDPEGFGATEAAGAASVKDYWWAVAKEYERLRFYDEAYEWFSKAPADNRLHRLSFLMRGQVALKEAQARWAEAEDLKDEIKRLLGRDQEEVELLQRRRVEAQEEGDRWALVSVTDAKQFIAMVEQHQEKYPDLGALPPKQAAVREIIEQERNALYGGYLLVMQSKYNKEDYAAVRELWPRFKALEFEASKAEDIRMKAAFMQLSSLIEPLDFQTAPRDELVAVMEEAAEVYAIIEKEADALAAAAEEDEVATHPIALQAPIYLGQKYIQLANRFEGEDPARYAQYQRLAGEALGKNISVVENSLKYGLMVGNIFTDLEMYDRAEIVFDKVLKVWDTEEKLSEHTLPGRRDAARMVVEAHAFYALLGDEIATEMRNAFVKLVDLAAPAEGRPEYLAARKQIRDIRKDHAEIRKANPDQEMLRDLPEDIETFLSELDEALSYQRDILQAKRNLVMAKIDLQKWDEAKGLIDDLLASSKGDMYYRELRGEVLTSQIEAAEAWNEETKKLAEQAREVVAGLMSKRPAEGEPDLRADRGTRTWWEALALNYRVKAAEYILRKGEPEPAADQQKQGNKSIVEEAARTMKHMRMWQSNPRYNPSRSFQQQMDAVYQRLAEAGFEERGLSQQKLAELREQADSRAQEAADAQRQREEAARRQRESKMQQIRALETLEGRRKSARRYFRDNPRELPLFRAEYPEEINRWMGAEPAEEQAPPEDAEAEPEATGGAADGGAAGGEADAAEEAERGAAGEDAMDEDGLETPPAPDASE
jgi:hypothetical protein